MPDLYLVSVVRHLRSVFNFISVFVVENLVSPPMKYRANISKGNDGDFVKKKKKMFELILGEIENQFRVPRVYQYFE